MTIFLRFLPFLVALLEAGAFYLQISKPLSYPWIVLVGVVALPLAAFAISFRRLSLRDMLGKMIPSFVLLATLAFSLLLAEGPFAVWTIVTLASVSCFVSLELLFLLVSHSSRYPMNALSRVNIAYVPIAVWYAAATSSGLLVFLHMDRVWHVAFMVLLGAVLFRTTGHAGASVSEKTVWTLVGVLVGAQAGLLGILLPVSMAMQGTIAAFILCVSLRARRYLVAPKPTKRQAWIEAVTAAASFSIVLSTAKWL